MGTKALNSCEAYNGYYHFVGATKYRLNLFCDEMMRMRLKEIIADIFEIRSNIELVECAVAYNHVHVLIKTDMTPSDVAQALFGISSRYMRKEFPILIEQARKGLWGGKSYRAITDEEHLSNAVSYIRRHQPDNTKIDSWDE